jgi:DNA-binding XRE family transcriptional regulator
LEQATTLQQICFVITFDVMALLSQYITRLYERSISKLMRIERHKMKLLGKQRRMLGLTQHQLAHFADVPPWKISWSETGRIKLTATEVARIQDVLAARAAELAAMVQADDAGRAGRSARLRSESREVA